MGMARLPAPPQPLLDKYFGFLLECVKNPLENIQRGAIRGLKQLGPLHLGVGEGHSMLSSLVKGFKNNEPAVARGFVQALGCLPQSLYREEAEMARVQDLLGVVCRLKRGKEKDDPESRKYGAKAIYEVIEAVGLEALGQERLDRMMAMLFECLRDYTVDKRGDIGSLVRSAAMQSLMATIRLHTRAGCLSLQNHIYHFIRKLLEELVEKIDAIRLLAGSLLQEFFDHYCRDYELPFKEQLRAVFCMENVRRLVERDTERLDQLLEKEVIEKEMQIQTDIFKLEGREWVYHWSSPLCVFHVAVPLLLLPPYTRPILEGLVVSAGGITESTVKNSLAAIEALVQGEDG